MPGIEAILDMPLHMAVVPPLVMLVGATGNRVMSLEFLAYAEGLCIGHRPGYRR